MLFDYVRMAREKNIRSRKGPPVPIEMSGLFERLRRAMREREIDQPELSRRSGVSQPTISNLCRGDSLEGATAVVIARLATALEVPSGWLLTAEGDIIPRLVARAEGKGPVVRLEEGGVGLVPPIESAPTEAPREASRKSR